ncbi:ATP-binding protein [Geobacillus icigianus]|uniref:Histidine kinase/HSP90-like ATPase domain-containing protein n=1 Tax=Geobacillus subterraneus TaxID=129338 RepID=A0A679FIX2_9BACL|nr:MULTISPECIES: ATP-binding protein [Geobacillus]KYD30954.1 Serine-protein kinase rsbW [Geobacillus sp. B4113_201601]BBW96118.1 hypothetical protein GsuE55_09510 [Geobacillus subterraneus]
MWLSWVVSCQAGEEAVEWFDFIAKQAARLLAVRDADLFVLAVHEAVVNAVKEAKRAGDGSRTISLSFFVTADDVTVMVEDEGDGISLETIERLAGMTLADVLLAESGRGLLLIREAMDAMAWMERPDGRRVLVMAMKRKAGWEGGDG